MSYIVDTLTQGIAETDATFEARVQTYINDQVYYFLQVGGSWPVPVAPGNPAWIGSPPLTPTTDTFVWDVTNSQFVRKVTFAYENTYYYKFLGTTPPLPTPPPAPAVGDAAIFGPGGVLVDSTLSFDTGAMNWTNLSPATTNGQAVEYSQLVSLITPAALTKTDDTNVTLTLGGTPATALLQGVSLTLGWAGTLADARIASAAAWNAKEPAITIGTNTQYWRGDKTFQTLDTLAVPENTNLYFTNARAIGSTLTGYASGAGTVSAADSILAAIQKLNGNIAANTSGTFTPTATGVLNVDSATGLVSKYIKVGSIVHVEGTVTIDATTTATLTTITLTLPISSNFTLTTDASGVCASGAGTGSGRISANAAASTVTLTITPVATSSGNYGYSYTYEIKP